jgi:hypothetical protein
MDKETWRENVENYQGAFVIWIDQGTDPRLKVHNSKGVCWGMAHEFVKAYQGGQPGPFDFVNGLRNAHLIWPGTSRIPPKYLQIQSSLQAMLTEYTRNLKILDLEYKNAEQKDKPAIKEKIKKFMDDRIKQRYGSGMTGYESFKIDNTLAPMEILKRMKATVTQNGPSYFLVFMRGPESGHAIAFGYRNDLSGSDRFPAIYEYFDANLGLFVFPSEENLGNFFNIDVWADLYGNTNYSSIEIASFTAKNGIR